MSVKINIRSNGDRQGYKTLVAGTNVTFTEETSQVVVAATGGGSLPTPICIELWQDAALTAWTNMPAALTEFRAILNTRTKLDLTSATQSRITVRVGVAPVVNAKIKVQYSTDETTWVDLCSVTMPATANKTNVGVWTAVPAGAKADVFIRLVGIDGDGAADPTFGLITLQVK